MKLYDYKIKLRLSFILFSSFVISALLNHAYANDISLGQSIDLAESKLSMSLQPAINSLVTIQQLGSDNISISLQAGLSNQTEISQLGNSNEILTIQDGDNNYLNINQIGDNNKADVYQFGSGNTANIQQSGNQYFLLEQHSDNAVVNVIQF